MQKFSLLGLCLAFLAASTSNAKDKEQFLTGDRSHGLYFTIHDEKPAEYTNSTMIIKNANCESATIVVDITYPGHEQNNYPMAEYIGCTTGPITTGLALRAFGGASANQV